MSHWEEFKRGWHEAGGENRRLWRIKVLLVGISMSVIYLIDGKLDDYTPAFWWSCAGAALVYGAILGIDRREQRRKP